MLFLGAVERRTGPALAGLLGAAPLTITLVVIGADRETGAAIAAHAGAHVVAQVPFFLAFAAVVTRRGVLAGVAAGAAAFAVVSLPVATVGVGVATAAAVPALFLAARASTSTTTGCETRRSPGGSRPRPPPPSPSRSSAPRSPCAALAGPAAAGTVAAFPALSTTLAFVVARGRGPRGRRDRAARRDPRPARLPRVLCRRGGARRARRPSRLRPGPPRRPRRRAPRRPRAARRRRPSRSPPPRASRSPTRPAGRSLRPARP